MSSPLDPGHHDTRPEPIELFVGWLIGPVLVACAIWFRERRRLVLARDPVGIKPLYWCFFDGVLTFASELKSIEAVVDAIIAAVLMRPMSAPDRRKVIDWLEDEFSIDDNQVLSTAEAEQLAALIAAVLISSVYFNLR